MATAVIGVTVTGTLDQEDRRAMLFVVNQANVLRAAEVPPRDALPISTNVEIRDSYRVVQGELLITAHRSYIQQSDVASLQEIRSLWETASDTQRNQARTALGG